MKTTAELINKLKRVDNIFSFLKENEKEFLNESVHSVLNDLLVRYNFTVGEISEKSHVGDYVYKVFSGTRNASRNILISIGIAMSCTINEMQLLLRVAGFALLDPRVKRDAIIIYAINYKKDVIETEELLLDANVPTLS